MATRMQQRRGTASTWTSANPILAAGEIGFEIDTNKFKIGDGSNRWANLSYFSDNEALTDLIDGAPGLLDTLNELAAAIGDDPAFFTTVATNLSNHEADSTNVHGIANTAELATKTFAAELLTNATKSNITITGDKNGLTITAENGVADSDTDDLVEGTTNLYFTNTRARQAVSGGTGISYDNSTGAISVTANTYDAYGAASTAETDANSYTDQQITALIGGAPGALDTLNELAAALGDDANYASTITNALALKAPLASPDLTGIPTAPTAALGTNTTQVATTAFVDAAIEALASRSLVLDGGGV